MGIGEILKNTTSLRHWQGNNPYYGAKFSVLGDSISTCEGYNPKNYPTFYGEGPEARARLTHVSNTWWQTVIDFFGAELLVNDAWSGSWVAKEPENDKVFPSACSDERTSNLHRGEEKPDVILIYLGVNDWYNGAPVNDERVKDLRRFDLAYDEMLRKLQRNYPSSEIWCCTLNTSYMKHNIGFRFPHAYAGVHIERYNAAIRAAAQVNGCAVIDLYRYNKPYETADGTHPTEAGMATMAREVIASMLGCDPEVFLASRKAAQPFETENIHRFEAYMYPASDMSIRFEHDQENECYLLSARDEGQDLQTIRLNSETVDRVYRLLAGFPFAEFAIETMTPPRAQFATDDLRGNDNALCPFPFADQTKRADGELHFCFEMIDGAKYACKCVGEPPADFVSFRDVLSAMFENRQKAFSITGMVPLVAVEKCEGPIVEVVKYEPPQEEQVVAQVPCEEVPKVPDFPCVCPMCRSDLQAGAIYCRLCGTRVADREPIPVRGVPDLPVQKITCKLCGAEEVFVSDKFCYRCGKRPK